MSLKHQRLLNHVPSFSFLSRRCCSGRPIHIVKSNLIEDQTNVISKLGKNEFIVLKRLGSFLILLSPMDTPRGHSVINHSPSTKYIGFTFTESNSVDSQTKNNDDIGSDVEYHVGHFPNQYPAIAHQNISQFMKNLNSLSPRDHWLVSRETKQSICSESIAA